MSALERDFRMGKSVAQRLVDDIEKRLASAESCELRDEELHGIVQPIGGVIGRMWREQNVFQLVKGMTRGKRLFIEDVQRRASQAAAGQGFNQSVLIDYRPAADINDHGRG